MNVGGLNYPQYWRLYKASRLRRYSHLLSWKEIFVYQIKYADPKQTKEIEVWAARANRGEDIKLPLKLNI